MNALEYAAARRGGRPMSTTDLILGMFAADSLGAWEHLQLEANYLGMDDVGAFPDPAPEAAGTWHGVPLTRTATDALGFAVRTARNYHLIPMPVGALALGLLANPTSGACRALLAGTDFTHSRLLEIVQDDVLGVTLEGFEPASGPGDPYMTRTGSREAARRTPEVGSSAGDPDEADWFIYPMTYRAIAAARSWYDDLRFVALFAAGCGVFEILVDGRRWYPVLAAALALLACRRLDAQLGADPSGRRLAVTAAVGVATLLLAARCVTPVSGSAAGRFVPIAAAALIAVGARGWRERWRPGAAGSLPSRRALSMVAADSVESHEDAPVAGSDRERGRLVWAGRPAVVTLSLAVDAQRLAGRDPNAALRLAHEVCEVVHAVIANPLERRLVLDEKHRLRESRGIALMTIAAICDRRDRPAEAADAYHAASTDFEALDDRTRAAECLIRGHGCALRSGHATAVEESRALDMMRAGFALLEREPGGVRPDDERQAARRELCAVGFDHLVDDVAWHPVKAGELALWMLASWHRTTLGAENETDLEPVDAADLRRRLSRRVALVYHCVRDGPNWMVRWVVVSPGRGEILGRRKLGSFHAPLPADRLGDVAAAVVPDELPELLAEAGGADGVCDLVIVPDGPLSDLPLAGLPLASGLALADIAHVRTVTSLTAIEGAAPRDGGGSPLPLYWDADGLPRADAPPAPTGVLTLPMAPSPELCRALQAAVDSAGGTHIDTGDFLVAAATVDPTFAALPAAGVVRSADPHGLPAEDPEGMVRVDARHDPVAVSVPMGQTLRRAAIAARHWGMPRLALAPVVVGATLDNRAGEMLARTPGARPFADAILAELGTDRDPEILGGPGAATERLYDADRVDAPAKGLRMPAVRGVRIARRIGWGAALVATTIIGASLIDPGRQAAAPQRGFLGIELSQPRAAPTLVQVVRGSPAASAGLRVGDRIDYVDRYRTTTPAAALALIRSHAPGTRVHLVVVRDDARRTLDVRMATAP